MKVRFITIVALEYRYSYMIELYGILYIIIAIDKYSLESA